MGTISAAVHIFALMNDLFTVHRPHVEVLEGDVRQRDNVRAANDNRPSTDTVINVTSPVVECKPAESNRSCVWYRVRLPVFDEKSA